MKKRVGRPALAKSKSRHRRVALSFTENEYRALREVAARTGVPPAIWIRREALRVLAREGMR